LHIANKPKLTSTISDGKLQSIDHDLMLHLCMTMICETNFLS